MALYSNESKKIKNLSPGEGGYAVPWAMAVFPNGDCFLNPEYTVAPKPGGTVSMWVEKTQTGYFVNAYDAYRITFGDPYEWNLSRDAYAKQNWLRVTEIEQ